MRVKLKRYWLLLLVMVLTTVIALPSTLAMAQKEIDGTEGLFLRMSPGSYQNEIVRGEDNTFYIEVVNNSSEPINGINLSTNGLKEGWKVSFEPQYIEALAANSYTTVDVVVRAPDNIEKGNHNVTVIAESGGIRAVLSIYLWVEESNPLWLWIGGAIAAVVVAGFIFVFMRMGRQ